MLKVLVVTAASLAMVTLAAAADLPHPQPVYQQASTRRWETRSWALPRFCLY